MPEIGKWPKPDEPALARLSHALELEERLALLEHVVAVLWSFVAGLVLAAGLLVPFVRAQVGASERSVSVLKAAGGGGLDGDPGGVVTIGFLGLLLVSLAMICFVLPAAAIGKVVGRMRIFAKILAALGIIGAIVPFLFSVGSSRWRSFDYGGLLLLLGMIVARMLIFSPLARRRESAFGSGAR